MSEITHEQQGAPTKKGHNNYTLGIVTTFFIGLGISLLALIVTHLTLGVVPDWVADLLDSLYSLFFVSRMVSGIGYLSRPFDIALNETTLVDRLKTQKVSPAPPADETALVHTPSLITAIKIIAKRIVGTRRWEFMGLVAGIVCSVALTVVELVFHVRLGMFTGLPKALGQLAFFIANVSSITGLTSRIGRAIDYYRASIASGALFKKQHVNYVLGVTSGLIVGIALFAIILGIAGTSAVTLGGALPLWFGVAFFLLTTVSTCASSAGYVGRVADVFLGKRTLLAYMSDLSPTPANQNTFKKSWEAKLTTIGVITGIIIATALIAGGLMGIPFLGAGLPAVFAGILLMGTCVSIAGGLGNRIGHAIDKKRGATMENLLELEKKAPTTTTTTTEIEKQPVTAPVLDDPPTQPRQRSSAVPTLFQPATPKEHAPRPRAYSCASFFKAPEQSPTTGGHPVLECRS